MKVGFFYQGTDARTKPLLDIGRHLVASVREVMPDVEIHQFTDDVSPLLAGIDGSQRIGGNMPMAVRRMTHHANAEGDWLFVDTDIVIRRDVRHVFDEPFDVALTNRDGTITNEARYAEVMPYNIGVVFSRCPEFWRDIIFGIGTMPPALQEWEGDQRAVAALMRMDHGFNVKILPGHTYNYPPRGPADPRMDDAAILHYKGNRKQWLK